MSRTTSPRALTAAAVLLAGALAAPALGQSFPPYPGTQPTKEASSPTVPAGGTIVWTITLYNDASTDEAAVFVSDDVPDPADGLPVQPWGLGDILSLPAGATASYNGDNLSIANVVIPGGGASQIQFQTRVLASAADGTQICNRAFARYVVTICGGTPPLCREESFDSQTRPPGGTSPSPVCVTVEAPASGADIQASVSDTVLTDSCEGDASFPSGDGFISPGETLSLTLAVVNTGSTDAPAQPAPIRGTLVLGSGYTIVQGASEYRTSGRRDILQRLSGNVGTNTAPFVIRVDPTVACPSVITLTLELTQIQGGPFQVTFTFPVGGAGGCEPRCLHAPVSAGPPTVRDQCAVSPPGGNGRIDPGEDLYLYIPVTNAGPDDLLGSPVITGTITSLTPGVTVIPGSGASDYPDLFAGFTANNATELGVRLDKALACGTAFTVRLTLTGHGGTPRVVDVPLAISGSCTPCDPPACTATAVAAAVGDTRFCEGGTVHLDGSASSLVGCPDPPAYQWLEGGTPVAGATQVSYDTPTSLAAGVYAYSVVVSCPSLGFCTATSAPIDVTVDPAPTRVEPLLGAKILLDAEFSWPVTPSATGGYRLYRTILRSLAGSANGTNSAPPAGSTPDSTSVVVVDPDVLDPALHPDPLYFYQTIAVCSDGVSEGPN